MARQQFDHQIKHSLEKREIRPSAGSWDQLSQRLDSAEKKRTPVLWWAGIAATLVSGFLIISMVFNNSNVNAPELVETPSEEINNKEQNPTENIIIASEETKKTETVKETEKSSEGDIKSEQPSKQPLQSVLNNNKSFIASEEIKTYKTKQENLEENAEKIEDNIVHTKLQEIIAEVSSRTTENGDATDAEINALLQKAAAEISQQQSREGLAGGVNAEDLLFDVEMELEQSFREKVFDLLKEGYSKAKTAVANRNYQ